MIISILYLVQPMHRQINHTLHSLSHILELPDQVIGHKDQLVDSHATHHYLHDHAISVTKHEHHIIDFVIDMLASDKEKQDQNKPAVDFLEMDKHLGSDRFLLEYIVESSLEHKPPHKAQSPCSGYLFFLLKPPLA